MYDPSANDKATVAFAFARSKAAQRWETITEGGIGVELIYWMKRPTSCKKAKNHTVKPDIDNMIKLTLDAAAGVLWKDDAQVCEITASKRYVTTSKALEEFTSGKPHTEITVWAMEDKG